MAPPQRRALRDSRMTIATQVNSPNPVPNGARPLGWVPYLNFYLSKFLILNYFSYEISSTACRVIFKCRILYWLVCLNHRWKASVFARLDKVIALSPCNVPSWWRDSSENLICVGSDLSLSLDISTLLAVRLVGTIIEDCVQFISDILTSSACWPWVSVLCINAALAWLSCRLNQTTGHWHSN